MAIRGSLREASLPDVLQLLAMGKKTGCLSITHRNAFGSVYFDRGRISFASIVNRRDRLGDLLVSNGVITREDLDHAIAAQAAEPQRRLGEILVARSLLTREELHQHIKRQIEEAVYYLFTWTQGTFSFEPDVSPDEQDFVVSINPESLLLEGARRIDEWSLIEKKVPSFDCVFALDRQHLAASHVELTMEQETILPLLDGVRDVAAILEASGLGEFEAGKALYGLAAAGFIHRVGRRRTAEQPSLDSRVAEHRNLGIAFYKSGMFDEAVRELRRALDLRPGDELSDFYLALLAIRQGRFDEAVRLLRLAATRSPSRGSIHANLAYALERQGRYDEARSAHATAERLLPDDPCVQLTGAVLALRRGDVEAADEALRAVTSRSDGKGRTAAWYHYAGLTAAYLGDLDRASSILAEGMASHPHAAILANNLAVVLERRGRLGDAAAIAERGLHESPALAQLHKNAGDLHYRGGRHDEALECYARAVRLVPDLGGDVWLKLGNLRYRRGESEDAVRCWERSVALAPDNPVARRNLEQAKRIA
jgi:tetratricopeptide (TPR) repeat protein